MDNLYLLQNQQLIGFGRGLSEFERGGGVVVDVDKTYTTISEQQEQHCLLTRNEVMVRLLELSPKRQLPVLLLLVVAIAVVVVIFVVIFDFV